MCCRLPRNKFTYKTYCTLHTALAIISSSNPSGMTPRRVLWLVWPWVALPVARLVEAVQVVVLPLVAMIQPLWDHSHGHCWQQCHKSHSHHNHHSHWPRFDEIFCCRTDRVEISFLTHPLGAAKSVMNVLRWGVWLFDQYARCIHLHYIKTCR